MKYLLRLLISLMTLPIMSQTSVKKQLDTITTVDQAKTFLESKKSKKNKILVFNEEKHKTKLARVLLDKSVGSTEIIASEFSKTHYKIIDKKRDRHYRISYIYFDGNKLEVSKIVEYKNSILEAYDKGIRFDDLAKRYSMDANSRRGGDSGWLKEGSMPMEVEEEAFNLGNSVDKIYALTVPDTNAFYIILKTHRIKKIKEITVLKVIDKD